MSYQFAKPLVRSYWSVRLICYTGQRDSVLTGLPRGQQKCALFGGPPCMSFRRKGYIFGDKLNPSLGFCGITSILGVRVQRNGYTFARLFVFGLNNLEVNSFEVNLSKLTALRLTASPNFLG